MKQYKKVLVAFDGSENGLKALDTAKQFTEVIDGELIVAFVHEVPLDHPVNVGITEEGGTFMFNPRTASSIRHQVKQEKINIEEKLPNKVLAIAKSKFADSQNVTYKKLVGKPAKEIVEYATTNGVDLIVIGSRGIGAIKKLVMGSVSLKVTNNSKCPVFVVK